MKPLQNRQPMEHRRLADILPTRKAPLNSPFGNELPPFYVGFRLPQKFPPNHQPRPHNQRQPENAFPRFQAALSVVYLAYCSSAFKETAPTSSNTEVPLKLLIFSLSEASISISLPSGNTSSCCSSGRTDMPP